MEMNGVNIMITKKINVDWGSSQNGLQAMKNIFSDKQFDKEKIICLFWFKLF